MTRGAFLRAAVAGFGASLVLTATMLALRLRFDAPTFPERVDDAVLLVIPQWLFSELLERFRFSAKPLLFVGLILAQILLATLGGTGYSRVAVALAGRIDLTSPFLGGAVGLFIGVVLDLVILLALGADVPIGSSGFAANIPALAMTALPGIAYGLALTTLLRAFSPPRPVRDPLTGSYGHPRGVNRRTAIAVLIPAAGALVTTLSLRRILTGVRSRQPGTVSQLPAPVASTPDNPPTLSPAPTDTPAIAPSPSLTNSFATSPSASSASPPTPPTAQTAISQPPTATPPTIPSASPTPTLPAPTTTPTLTGPQIPAGVAPRITPTKDFYTISKNFLDPLVRAEYWELTIAGQVERPRTLRYGDLRQLPAVSQPTTLTCISNEVGGALIGTAIWTGVPLAALLADAGVRSTATHVVFNCEDGYVETLPIAAALDPATLLVHTMNGEPLWEVHGFPARLIVPGRYGMKNPKWISRIEAATRPPTGYWTERGWSPDEPVQTSARIDVPGLLQSLPLGPTTIGGVAFAGDRGISRVEVSTDGGTTWRDAELEPALGRATWVRWTLAWTPTRAGKYTIVARARDGNGTLQTPTARKSGPGGATGYDRREVTIGM